MISAIVINAAGAATVVGGWTLAVVHTHRSLAADERAATRAARPGVLAGTRRRTTGPGPRPAGARPAPAGTGAARRI